MQQADYCYGMWQCVKIKLCPPNGKGCKAVRDTSVAFLFADRKEATIS